MMDGGPEATFRPVCHVNIYVRETVYLLIWPGLSGVEMIIRVCLRTGFITSSPSADEAMDG